MDQLRMELATVIERLKTEPRFVNQAVEINNAAGKMINSCKVQVEYMQTIKKPVRLKFLESVNGGSEHE